MLKLRQFDWRGLLEREGSDVAPRRRMTLDLNLETVQQIVRSLDPSLTAERFGRLEGGSAEVYKIDVVGADAKPLVFKIYSDEPAWLPAKELLVSGWLAELTPTCSTVAVGR